MHLGVAEGDAKSLSLSLRIPTSYVVCVHLSNCGREVRSKVVDEQATRVELERIDFVPVLFTIVKPQLLASGDRARGLKDDAMSALRRSAQTITTAVGRGEKIIEGMAISGANIQGLKTGVTGLLGCNL